MPAILGKLFRLALARGPLALLGAALGAGRDACRERRLRIALTPQPECAYRMAWRRPTRQHFMQALYRRLGLAGADFRRRAESAADAEVDASPPAAPCPATVLLAGERALDDARVRAFLLAQAAGGALHLARPGEAVAPQAGRVTLLAGVEADAAGQARLRELRRRGIACDWLSAASDVAPGEIPLREACLRQASPAGDAAGIDFAEIVVPSAPVFHQPVRPVLRRPLRILSYRWHVPHQYELFKLGAGFSLVSDLGEGNCRWWDLGQRPFPANARFVRWRDIDPDSFDLAILHFDEHVLDRPGKDAAVGARWGETFRFLLRNLRIPRIAVCHGTPQAADASSGMAGAGANRQALVDLLAETPVVVNSHQAHGEWGFRQSRVIWQGFDPREFPARPPSSAHRAQRILTLPRSAYALRPAYHGAAIFERVAGAVAAPFEQLRVPEPNLLLRGNAYARAKFAHYIDTLHGFDIYFNPTLHSPMPRTRGEAMMCGLATVNATSHDVDGFIRNGVNGFHAGSAEELAEQIRYLLAHREDARRIGLAGRATAIESFGIERFLADWRQLIRDTLGDPAL